MAARTAQPPTATISNGIALIGEPTEPTGVELDRYLDLLAGIARRIAAQNAAPVKVQGDTAPALPIVAKPCKRARKGAHRWL